METTVKTCVRLVQVWEREGRGYGDPDTKKRRAV